MPSNKERIVDVVGRLVPEVVAHAQRRGKTVQPTPKPPASKSEIAKYEEYLGLRLPPTYRTFLELHNGYDWLAYPGHMLSTGDVAPGGDWYDRIRAWKTTTAQYGVGEVLEAIVIANLGSEVNWGYLDPTRPSVDAEFIACRWLNGDRDDFPDVVEFLESRIRFCRIDLRPRSGRRPSKKR